MKDEFKSLSLAVILSFIAIYSVNIFFGVNKNTDELTKIKQIEEELNKVTDLATNKEPTLKEETQENIEEKRLNIDNGVVKGSIRLNGSRFDNLLLEKYSKTLDNKEEKVELLAQNKTENPYFAEFGWLSLDKNIKLPNSKSLWSTTSNDITTSNPAVLTWKNDAGLKFIRKITVDDNYLFTITDTVENLSGEEIEVFPYALISRDVANFEQNRSVVHEGLSAVIDGTLKEFKYSDLKGGESETFETEGGWVGFSDRYWFSALITPDKEKNKITMKNNSNSNYQVDYLGKRFVIPNGEASSYTYKFYAGAKEIKLLDKYTKHNGIPKFDLAVDFGWYYFLTKPFFYILDFLYGFLGNMGWAILLFAAILSGFHIRDN